MNSTEYFDAFCVSTLLRASSFDFWDPYPRTFAELHTYAKPFGPIDCTLLGSLSQLCCDFAKPAFQFVVEVRLLFAGRLEGRNWSLRTFAKTFALLCQNHWLLSST